MRLRIFIFASLLATFGSIAAHAHAFLDHATPLVGSTIASAYFIRRAESRTNYQDFFGGGAHPEPIPSERDAVMTGGRCDNGKAHRRKLTAHG
jgi:hypothetical protein